MEDLQISKKLISEVLKIPLDVINEVYFDKTHLLVRKSNNRIEEHNIYEFAFKCKEWALKKGFKIYSSCKSSSISQDGILLWISSGENNEIETIIKACEWILENSK